MKFKQFIFGAFVYLAVLTVFIVVCNMVADAKAATIQPIAWKYAVASAYDDVGGPLACGGRLTNHMMGVAHKTLPCGTRLTMRYHGRKVHVVVRDRGPYVYGRDFDLMPAVYHRFGFRTANDWGHRRLRYTRGWK